MTINQKRTINFINASIFTVGSDKSVTLDMHMNANGGFWVDLKSSGFSDVTITGSCSESDMETAFSDIAAFVDITKSKKNRELQAVVIDKLINFYN